MSTVLFNPTNENLTATHSGIDTTINKYPDDGHMLKVDDGKAAHLLNILGPRGLTTLDYGDEGETKDKKASAGKKRNLEFKKKMVIQFNAQNQMGEQRNLPYLPPTKELIAYADELGIKLVQTYTLPDADAKKIGKLTRDGQEKDKRLEIESKKVIVLEEKVDKLTKQIGDFMAIMQGQSKPEKEQEEKPTEPAIDTSKSPYDSIVVKVKTLNKPQFTAWMKKSWEEMADYPEKVKAEVNARHEKLFGMPLPDKKPE